MPYSSFRLAISLTHGSDGKASAYNLGDLGLIPGSGRSPGEGNGNPLQYSGLENPMDRVVWWARVHGFTTSQILKYRENNYIVEGLMASK